MLLGSNIPDIGSWNAISQPHMIAVLEALKKTKVELEVAEHSKRGHRAKALEFVNKDLEQTKKCIEVGKKENSYAIEKLLCLISPPLPICVNLGKGGHVPITSAANHSTPY